MNASQSVDWVPALAVLAVGSSLARW